MSKTIEQWEALYPEKLEAMRIPASAKSNKQFSPVDMQRLHGIGYNHAMRVIEVGLESGKIIELNYRYQFV